MQRAAVGLLTFSLLAVQLEVASACVDSKGASWCAARSSKCHKKQIKRKCAQTCNTCDDGGGGETECKNEKSTSWCKQQKNKCHRRTVANKCKKTCGVCADEGESSSPAPPPAVCEDSKSTTWCKSRKKRCNKASIRKKCTLTCEQCPSQASPPALPPVPGGLAMLPLGAKTCVTRTWFRFESGWDANVLSECAAKTREHAGTLCEGNYVQFPQWGDHSTNWGCMCCKPGGGIYQDAPTSNWRLWEIFDFPLSGASDALISLRTHYEGGSQMDADDLERALAIAEASAGLQFEPYLTLVDDFIAASVQPSSSSPVQKTDTLDYLAAEMSLTRTQALPAEKLSAHPAAVDFPGLPESTAKLAGEQTASVLATYAGRDADYLYSGAGAAVMRSTGLYAGPGETVHVTLPANAANAGLGLRIGCHSDSLGSKDTIKRSIKVTRDYALTTVTTVVANAFGGLLYVTVPAGASLGLIDVKFSGGVFRSLTFHHASSIGRTDDLAEWASLKAQPVAPWAEFITSKIILTVPASAAKAVADPVALMTLWDEMMDHAADLEGVSRTRARPERFVLDRQISAGWMHSGYPIMGHVDGSVDDLLDLAPGSSGDHWGPFHELGHNFQYRPWVLPRTTETTCNLWSVFLFEKLGVAVGHGEVSPSSLESKISAYLATGPSFAEWGVWTALVTYLQLKDGFGWAFYTDLFTRYRTQGLSPSDDDERIDEWVRQSSIVANRDLGPFYLAWGFPVSQDVLDEVALLPAWAEDPMIGYASRRRTSSKNAGLDASLTNGTRLVDYRGGAVSLDQDGAWAAFDDLEALVSGRVYGRPPHIKGKGSYDHF